MKIRLFRKHPEPRQRAESNITGKELVARCVEHGINDILCEAVSDAEWVLTINLDNGDKAVCTEADSDDLRVTLGKLMKQAKPAAPATVSRPAEAPSNPLADFDDDPDDI